MPVKKTVLFVEDDPSILDVVKLILQDTGHRVLTANSGETLFQILQNDKPDLLLLDIWLNGEDGSNIARQLKAQEHTADIKIVLVSANSETERLAKEAGVDGFLLKPFDVDQLMKLVASFVGNPQAAK